MDIDEHSKHLKPWVRRKKTGLKLICSGCGQHVEAGLIHEVWGREVRGLGTVGHEAAPATATPDAIDEVRRAEFFRQDPRKRWLIKGKRWLLLRRWKNLTWNTAAN
jgi:hypothetical protein